ncbi:MAG: 3-hydroxyacyl-CoA dehydrogenase family protein [Desulfobaccales bacterium]
MARDLKVVTILGAGTMGHALALIFARAGCEVCLTDVNEGILDKALELIRSHAQALNDFGEAAVNPDLVVKRIQTSTDFRQFIQNSDLVIEAIIENAGAKKQLFSELAGLIKADGPAVTSNTSYLDVFPLAPEKLLERFLITHFYNPPYLVPLVELVANPRTDPQIFSRVHEWLGKLGLVPVTLNKFMPGCIVNRIQWAINREIYFMIDEGYADAEKIDRAVKASLGVRLPITGVVERLDHTGLDHVLRVLEDPPKGLAPVEKISPTLKRLVAEGHFGLKTGKGFFDYGDKPLAEIIKERDYKLMRVKKLLQELGEL